MVGGLPQCSEVDVIKTASGGRGGGGVYLSQVDVVKVISGGGGRV